MNHPQSSRSDRRSSQNPKQQNSKQKRIPPGQTFGTRPPLQKKNQKSSQTTNQKSWGHEVPPSKERLGVLLQKHGVQVPNNVLDKLWIYHQLLRKNNGDQDLTRLIGFETIAQRHYADCLILHGMMKRKWPSPLVDIGTGAGFPGLMIKLISPETEIILSEPRPRRVEFLNMVIRELGLKGISVFGHKFTSRSFNIPVQGAITRAFESIALTLPRLGNSLQPGGIAIFMKGPGVDEELEERLPRDYRLIRDERYRIAGTTLDRALVIFERTADLNDSKNIIEQKMKEANRMTL